MRHGQGRLIVLRPGPDGEPDNDSDGERVLDVAVTDVLEVRLSRRADDAVVIEIYLRYPTPVLTGVPADRTPLPVLIAEHDVPAAAEIVSRINDQILASQRIDVAAPDLTPPPPQETEDGPVRADVQRAARRMTPHPEAESAVADLHRYVTGEEYVLETAVVVAHPPAGHGTGLLAVTTQRLLFVSIGDGARYAHELPIPAVMWARATDDTGPGPGQIAASPGESAIEVHDGNAALRFTSPERTDADRIAYAVNFVVRLVSADGSAGPADPSVAQLYAEWELLVERHSLGMVDDSQFQRYGRGILRSLPRV
ncbi:hypothetical protein B0T44_00480 [Nocardia donostiensis]|uniref:Uncharacterized protein n=1 Tax=Nocardia donostiensis TaxID=1538463 RepID=A0A1W0BP32_9NOCA|nr:hypothetical protein B0T46_17555 [Nocardia donostiensis]OQS14387.1 hypothetical protein B0T36_15505 [Nocardia donostiensis]OQS24146.1 hypothetical protein B0T44_00480 [Nocardia donostiensis]